MNSGPYQVHAKFQHLTKTATYWTKQGKISRERHLKQIHTYPFKPYDPTEVDPTMASNVSLSEDSIDLECDKENIYQLSVPLAESGLPMQVFKSIWSKASEILAKDNAIVDSPGSDNIKVCISYTSLRPHIVTMFETGKITCDCKNNESIAVCP